MTTILLVDDDAALLEVLALAFGDAGYSVETAPDGATALERIRTKPPDAVVSDVNMPSVDGFALCRKLRAEGYSVPFVLLTSRDNEIDEALGLDLGADDFIAKPFSTRVLLSRIAALLRRDALHRRESSSRPPLESGGLVLDPDRLEARYRDTLLKLTLTEFRILEAFARKPGVVLSRERLLEIVRGDDSVVADRIIDTYVRRLRRKLEAIDPKFAGIETVIGAGYRFRPEQ
jgi:DNA-binding response OmpR family regulator